MARKVLVTGATGKRCFNANEFRGEGKTEPWECSGFVATELIKQLLEKGYSVVGTVRSSASNRSKHLKKLEVALPGSLQLVEADLLVPGAFDTVVQECTFVFHTAYASTMSLGALRQNNDLI